MISPYATTQQFVAIGKRKIDLSIGIVIVKAILAGIFIGIAGLLSSVGAATIQDASMARLVSALIFPIGLIMVVFTNAELFTGNNLIIISVLEKKTLAYKMMFNLCFVFLFNFVGVMIVVLLTYATGLFSLFDGQFATYAIKAAQKRFDLPFLNAILSGFFCNILVCAAVWLSQSTKKIWLRIVFIFTPIMLFVLLGLEHSIANMYFVPTGILVNAQLSVPVEGFLWTTFLLSHLLPVTIGNMLGGMGIIGLGSWIAFLRNKNIK